MTDPIRDDDAITEDERRAAYSAQMKALGLRPWQSPPCWLSEDIRPEPGPSNLSNYPAWVVLRTMLRLGIDRYHPDPIRAIAEARARR